MLKKTLPRKVLFQEDCDVEILFGCFLEKRHVKKNHAALSIFALYTKYSVTGAIAIHVHRRQIQNGHTFNVLVITLIR